MTSTLTLRLTDPNKWDHASRYEVCGLPLGERAKIGEMEGHHLDGHHWQILLTKDGVPGNWEGDVTSSGRSILDLFAPAAEVYFPKWGLAKGREQIGKLIQRCFIYLDPDYAGKDTARYPWLKK